MQQSPTNPADWVIILPVILSLLGAALLLMLRDVRRIQAVGAFIVALVVFACDLQLLVRVMQAGPLSMTMGRWLPPFGISFTADVTSAAFALVSALVTLVVLVYAQMDRAWTDDRRDGFYPLVLLLLAGVSGAFLTGDLFNLYVWFEVMLIASFGLLVLGGTGAEIDAGVKYGFLNFLATSFFLIALGLLYGLLGTLNMADIVLSAPKANPAALASVAALFVLAFGMKAAAFPVNAWLPASYHTPPAAISALFGSLLTKVGAYALLRTLIVLLPGTHSFLSPFIAAIAILTLVLAPMGAIAETNLRRAVGFMVIGGVGAVIAGLALPSVQGLSGAVMYVLHAMLTLTALYMVAGLIEKLTGTKDTRFMGGVYAANSLVSVLFLVLILALAGVPPFLGFWPKLLLLSAGTDFSGIVARGGVVDYGALALVVALLLNAILTLVAGSRLWAHIFWRAGPEGTLSERVNDKLRRLSGREAGFGLVATTALVALVFLAGIWPNLLFEIAHIAASDLINPQRYIAAVGLGGAP